uniref:Uncharacterized protein n=1 Tax=Glossina brevipalpis TaxID=37001 RepID=A0A1A9WLZ7_9MUSC
MGIMLKELEKKKKKNTKSEGKRNSNYALENMNKNSWLVNAMLYNRLISRKTYRNRLVLHTLAEDDVDVVDKCPHVDEGPNNIQLDKILHDIVNVEPVVVVAAAVAAAAAAVVVVVEAIHDVAYYAGHEYIEFAVAEIVFLDSGQL